MRASLLAVLALVFPLFAGAQEDARAALALVMGTAPPAKEAARGCKCGECGCGTPRIADCEDPKCPNKKKPDTLTYAKAYKLAIERGGYVFVWVGQPAHYTKASQHTYVEIFDVEAKEFPDAQAPCLVISKAVRGKLLRLADLPGSPAEEAILKVMHPRPSVNTYDAWGNRAPTSERAKSYYREMFRTAPSAGC